MTQCVDVDEVGCTCHAVSHEKSRRPCLAVCRWMLERVVRGRRARGESSPAVQGTMPSGFRESQDARHAHGRLLGHAAQRQPLPDEMTRTRQPLNARLQTPPQTSGRSRELSRRGQASFWRRWPGTGGPGVHGPASRRLHGVPVREMADHSMAKALPSPSSPSEFSGKDFLRVRKTAVPLVAAGPTCFVPARLTVCDRAG